MRFAILSVAAMAMVPMIAACTPASNTPAEAPATDATAVEETSAVDAAALTPASAAVLANVDLTKPITAIGNEPSWNVTVADNTLSYSTMEITTPLTGTITAPVVSGNSAAMRTTLSDGKPAVLTLTGTTCNDTMVDRTYALTARLEVDGKVLNGCAASKAGLDAAGETGHVQ